MCLKAVLVNLRAYKNICEPCDQLNCVFPGVPTEGREYIHQVNMSSMKWMADDWWFI